MPVSKDNADTIIAASVMLGYKAADLEKFAGIVNNDFKVADSEALDGSEKTMSAEKQTAMIADFVTTADAMKIKMDAIMVIAEANRA